MNVEQKKEFYKRNSQNKKTPRSVEGSLEYMIDTAETKDLTGDDLMKICNNKVKVVPYHELKDVESIKELLEPHGAVILLYETKQNFGHYTALFFDGNNNLEFFDSYGFKPDDELRYAKYDNIPYLTNLLNKYNGKIVYNVDKLQKFARDINTCGRWTSLRIRLRKLDKEQFSKLWKGLVYHNADFFATALTFLYTDFL